MVLASAEVPIGVESASAIVNLIAAMASTREHFVAVLASVCMGHATVLTSYGHWAYYTRPKNLLEAHRACVVCHVLLPFCSSIPPLALASNCQLTNHFSEGG